MTKSVVGKVMIIGGVMIVSSMLEQVQGARCPRSCRKLIGNGECDTNCNTEECLFDGGDCESYEYEYSYEYDYEVPTPEPTRPTRKPVKKPTFKPVGKPTFKPVGKPTLKPVGKPVANPTTPTTPTGVDTTRYNIDIVFAPTVSDTVRNAFNNAKARWESVVVGDIPSTFTMKAGTDCFDESWTRQSQNRVVDDLLIFADTPKIDGVNGILGQAGPCEITTGQNGKEYSRVGLMSFDIADINAMVASKTLEGVILHEMGHILGIGTLWETRTNKLVQRVNSKVAYFNGPKAAEGLASHGGSGKPVVETQGGGGTAYGHWDEETYENELMTGYVDKDMRMSAMTVKSLEDLGLVVDVSKADQFTLPNLRKEKSSLRKEGVHVGDDIIRKPPRYSPETPY